MLPLRIRLECGSTSGGRGGGDLPGTLRSAFERMNRWRARASGVAVEIVVPPVQRRRLRDLPPVARRHLRPMVQHQAARFFRESPNGLVTNAVTARIGSERHTVVAVALDASIAAAILETAGAAGIRVVDIVACGEGIPPGLSLLPPRELHARTARSWRLTRRIAMGTALLVGATGAALVANRFMVNQSVEEELGALQEAVVAGRLARARFDSARDALNAITEERRRREDLLLALERLVDAAPDSAVLTSARLHRDGALELGGIALEPLQVVAALRRAGTWNEPRLSSDPTPELFGGRNWSRFVIRSGAPQ